MNSKKFLGIFFILTLFILGTNAAINFKYDLYGVFVRILVSIDTVM